MKLTAFILLIALTQISAKGVAQSVTISRNNISLEKIFRNIQKQTGYHFLCTKEQLSHSRKVDINLKNAPLEVVLSHAFKDQPLTYSILNKTIIVRHKPATEAIAFQEAPLPPPIRVTGTVTDSATGNPLVGVTIKVKDNTMGAVTDANGQFSLDVPDDAVLEVSYLGYTARTISVNGQTTINIRLSAASTGLTQLVVTALGIQRKEKALGYAVQKISGSDVRQVKSVNIGSALTGKIAGLKIQNSTEFFSTPKITMRGETPLLVINGVPYSNMTLRDISSDDIESISVLKGSTASALYGERGGNGAIIITTKKGAGAGEGLTVTVNSNTMFNAGFLTLPEVQHSYSAGLGGHYDPTDYVWGAKLDNGTKVMQWDPVSKQMKMMELTSRGRNNFKNFLEPGFITNNNISVAQVGETGSFRASLTDIYKKGQYPNAKLNMINFSLSGEMDVSDKFKLVGTFGYNKRSTPQIHGAGYGDQGYIYNILMWTGPAYDLAKYRDYWVIPDVQQNWLYKAWYDNPYMMAYEKLHGVYQNTFNTSLSASYDLFKGATLMVRSGMDYYSNKDTYQNPPNINGTRGGNGITGAFDDKHGDYDNTAYGYNAKGMYSIDRTTGFSINNDVIFTINKRIGDFGIDGLAGGTIYYYQDEALYAGTRNGLSIPGFYSLASSNERPDVSSGMYKKQVNSVYGKLTLDWKSAVYLDVTGRNDWSSTLPESTRSYFYPSVATSVVLSELMELPDWLSFWKVRGSWALSKSDLDVYATNRAFSTSLGVWSGLNAADYPNNIGAAIINPETARTWEIGTHAYLFGQRLQADVAYYNKYRYNLQDNADISSASGFSSSLVNIDETYVRKGVEITLSAIPVKTAAFQWQTTLNWSTSHEYYKTLDSIYSPDNLWTKVGSRKDVYTTSEWLKSPNGQVVLRNGLPVKSDYQSLMGYTDPDWIFGFTNSFSWKNFVLTLGLDGRIGGVMYDYIDDKMWDTGAQPATDNKWRYDEVVNGKTNYVADGVKLVSGSVEYDKYGRITKDTRTFTKNDVPVSYESFARKFRAGDYGLQDPSFVKLREVSVQYNLPSALANKIGAEKASVALTGQNVFLWTNFRYSDPDRGEDDLNSPAVRYLGVNINLTF